jgi:RES domain-containing protein
LRFQGVCYRAHDPRWAWAPTSGDGAAIHGGRFNPKGKPALYLASSIEGMFAEMGHGFARRFEPLTVCCYDLDMEDMADLRSHDVRKKAGIPLSGMACPWMLDLAEGRRPASWDIARRLMDEGAAGALVPSFANRLLENPAFADEALFHDEMARLGIGAFLHAGGLAQFLDLEVEPHRAADHHPVGFRFHAGTPRSENNSPERILSVMRPIFGDLSRVVVG